MKHRSRQDTGRSRSDDGRQLKLDLRQVIAKHRVTERDLSEALAIDEALVNRRLRPLDEKAHLQLVDVVRMPEAVQVDVIRMLAQRLGFDLAPIASDSTRTAALRRSADLLSSASATAIEAIQACEDDVLDRAEALRIRPLAAKVRQVATAIEHQCEQAISEGVVSLAKGGLS